MQANGKRSAHFASFNGRIYLTSHRMHTVGRRKQFFFLYFCVNCFSPVGCTRVNLFKYQHSTSHLCVCVFLVGIVSQFAKQTTTKGIQLWNAIHWLKSCVRDFSAPLSKDYLLFEEKEWRKQFSLVFFHHFTPFPEFPGRHPKFVQQTEEKFIKVGCVLNLDGCLNKMEECASE